MNRQLNQKRKSRQDLKGASPQELEALRSVFDAGRYAEAAALAQAISARFPQHWFAWTIMGASYRKMGRGIAALAAFRQAEAVAPNVMEVQFNLGLSFHLQGDLDAAEACYRKALLINRNNSELQRSLGALLQDLGRLGEAEACFAAAIQIDPNDSEAHSNLLYTLTCDPDRRNEDIFAAHLSYESRLSQSHPAAWPRHGNDRDGGRRLRIGYVSADFCRHSVAYFIAPLLREHDHSEFEICLYSDVSQADSVTAMLQSYADRWFSSHGLSDAALEARILQDGIDILVDLSGHSARNRLPVFACKPAPLQISWIGYPNTTGLSAMDYRFVDAITDPPGDADSWASETLVRLDDGFLCFDPPADAPPPAPPPCLAKGQVTFGSFNNPTKLSASTLDAWAELMHRVPGSHLLLKAKSLANEAVKSAFLRRLIQRGVDADRITLLGFMPGLASHLAAYEQIDVALDPFPYNGTTTSCEALWMGVPVVTLVGTRHAGRVGASLLTRIGLSELIADSVDAYIEIAARLATDAARLSALRQGTRELMRNSPLCAPQSFARKIESAYRGMWRDHCAGSTL